MKLQLVDDWRSAWRWASVRLAVLVGAISSVGIAAWPVLQWLIDSYLPAGVWRAAVAALAFLLTAGIPIATRLLTKRAAQETSDGQ